MKTLEEKRKCYEGHCTSHSRIESRMQEAGKPTAGSE